MAWIWAFYGSFSPIFVHFWPILGWIWAFFGGFGGFEIGLGLDLGNFGLIWTISADLAWFGPFRKVWAQFWAIFSLFLGVSALDLDHFCLIWPISGDFGAGFRLFLAWFGLFLRISGPDLDHFWSISGVSGPDLGRLWSILGAEAHFGDQGLDFGPFLAYFGGLRASIWAIFGPFWASGARIWAIFGPLWRPGFWAHLAQLWPILGVRAWILIHILANWGGPGLDLGCIWVMTHFGWSGPGFWPFLAHLGGFRPRSQRDQDPVTKISQPFRSEGSSIHFIFARLNFHDFTVLGHSGA